MSKEYQFTKWIPYSCQLTVKDIEDIMTSASAYGGRISGSDITNAFMTADLWIELFISSGATKGRLLFRK